MNEHFIRGFEKVALSTDEKKMRMLEEPADKKHSPQTLARSHGVKGGLAGALFSGGAAARRNVPMKKMMKRLGKGGLLGAAGGALLGYIDSLQRYKAQKEDIIKASPKKTYHMYNPI